MTHRIALASPHVASVQRACQSAGLNATVRELGQDTLVSVYGADGFEVASVRLTGSASDDPDTIVGDQPACLRDLWRWLTETITQNVAF